MCLDSKLTSNETKIWLKDKPEMITAYKEVSCYAVSQSGKDYAPSRSEGSKIRMFPRFHGSGPFKRRNLLMKVSPTNKIKKVLTDFATSGNPTTYVAYYHLYVNKKDAKKGHIIECQVPKKFITVMGYQFQGKLTIVTRCFHIVGEDKYLEQ